MLFVHVSARLYQEGVMGDVLPGDLLMKTALHVMGLFWPKQWLTFISVESVIVSYNVGYKENYITYWDLCTFKLITSKKATLMSLHVVLNNLPMRLWIINLVFKLSLDFVLRIWRLMAVHLCEYDWLWWFYDWLSINFPFFLGVLSPYSYPLQLGCGAGTQDLAI